MLDSNYSNLHLNGQYYSTEELRSLVQSFPHQPKSESWEKEMWSFIGQWINDEPYIIAHTSGSTGHPKPIRIHKQRMVHSALATGIHFNLKKGQSALLCLPCHYIAGMMMVVRSFVLGLELRTIPPNDLSDLPKYEIDFAAMVPMQVSKALKIGSNHLDSIEQLIIGGAPVSGELLQELQVIKTHCYATYGMTETITHIATKPLNGPQSSSHFTVLDGVSISQDSRECLVIDAPKVAEEIIVTNDIVTLLNPYTFTWNGRLDNVINSGGVKIHPEQVEEKLNGQIPYRFFIASIPHELLGEQVIMVIESDVINDGIISTIQQTNKAFLTTFELPKQILHTPSFLETPSSKIKRKATLAQILR